MATEEQEREARRNGWLGRDGWKGDPEKFVEADVFLERASTFVPFLKAETARLKEEIAARDAQLGELQTAVRASNAAIAALQESNEADVKEQVEAARKELKAEIARASSEGDHAALAEATANLSELDAEQAAAAARAKEVKAAGGTTATQRGPALDPEIKAWMEENKPFMQNMRKAALANGIMAEKREKGDTRKGREILDEVRDEVEEIISGGQVRSGDGKASGGSGGGGRQGASGGGKTYADLPAEARAACDRQAAKLVGPNRAHKNEASWQASYAAQYFKEG